MMDDQLLEQAREVYNCLQLVKARIMRQHAQLAAHTGPESPYIDMTFPQWNTLQLIRDRGPLSIKELADHASVSAPSASAMVERLVGMELVVREPSPHDRREVKVRLTPRGREALSAMESFMLQSVMEMMEKLGPKHAQMWVEVYQRIREVIEDELAEARAASLVGE